MSNLNIKSFITGMTCRGALQNNIKQNSLQINFESLLLNSIETKDILFNFMVLSFNTDTGEIVNIHKYDNRYVDRYAFAFTEPIDG